MHPMENLQPHFADEAIDPPIILKLDYSEFPLFCIISTENT